MGRRKSPAICQRTLLCLPQIYATLFGLLVLVASVHSSSVTISQNGYTGIVVAFSSSINQTVGEPLIPRIKELFTNASIALYNATRHRAYFKEVTILIPQEWNAENITIDEKAGMEVFGEADIRIDDPNPQYNDGPYTLQPLGCGSEGLFIHLTPGYLRNLTTSTKFFGDPGKTLVHEWAHLRYGIFDEFGYSADPAFPMAYYDDEDLLPNSCTNGRVNGVWKDVVKNSACSFNENSGMPNDDCAFLPDAEENDHIDSSIASYHFLRKVSTFCDDGEQHYHNPIAPNKHNVLCEGESTWSVIEKHKDFAGKNERSEIKNLTPTFKIKQRMEATYCLVLDTSGSMGHYKPYSVPERKDILHAAVKRWMQEELTLGSAVGIVPFASDVVYNIGNQKYPVPVTKIDNEDKRSAIIKTIPKYANGGTGIGSGLKKGIELLEAYRHGPGGIIILVTDGEETDGPMIKDVLGDLKKSQVRVVTIALHTSQGKKLQELAEVTGGKLFSIPIGAGTEKLGMAFYEALTYQASEFDLPQKIHGSNFTTDSSSYVGKFSIDSTIGNDTTIDFSSAGGKDTIANVTISGPNIADTIRNASHKETNDKLQVTFARFKYPSLKEGEYTYTIKRSEQSKNVAIQVTVTSKANSKTKQPIITRSWIQQDAKSTAKKPRYVILAEVKQGNNPIIKAAVMAKVDRPNKESVLIQLFDNGNKAPDVTRDDGIYSRYFTRFSGKGRYSVEVQVTDEGEASIREVGFTGSRSMPVTNDFQANPKVTETKTGAFGRESSSGAFDIEDDTLQEDKVDLFPPSRVSDLHVSTISEDQTELTFTWTAPGGDLDYGNASRYEFRYSSNWTLLKTNFNDTNLLDAELTPLPAGQAQSLTTSALGLDTVYVAMIAVDKANQPSPLSNIAVVGKRTQTPDDDVVVIIVGAVLACLVVIVAIAAAVMFYKKKKQAQAATEQNATK